MDLSYYKKKKKRCCVSGCEDDVSKRHRFPKNNLNLFNAWITAIQNPVLATKSVEEVYLSYYVCRRHFTSETHVPGTRRGLMANAVPSLFLPSKDSVTSEVSLEYVTPIEATTTSDLVEPITTSTLSFNAENDTYTTTETTSSPVTKLCKARRLYLQEVNVSRSCDLTPRCKKFYKFLMRLYRIKNCQIFDKLLSGVSEKEVLRDVRLSAPQAVRREHLFSRKDLHNLKHNFGIRSISEELSDSRVKVKDTSWMRQAKELENYPVIFLKEPYEKCDLLNEEDFCVVLMADYQSLMLKKFGFKLICVGIAYDINGCEFHLVTILIIDEYEERIPVAFCVTSVVNINLMIIFFQAVKKKVGNIKSKIFIGDDPICYSAWKQTFNACQFPLLCMWHVLKKWREHVRNINKGKREMVFQALKDLIYQLNKEIFQKMLLELLDLLKKDTDTQEFEKYFTLNYANCTAMWAYCYRKDLKIGSNICVETFHKALKNAYLNGRKMSIVKCTEKLVDLIINKQFDYLIKSYKGKLGKKTTSYMRHKESITCDYIFNEINENTWEIHSFERIYIINKNHSCDNNCIIACRLCYCCFTAYKCTCFDNSISKNICKHIHYIARLCNSKHDKFPYTGPLNNKKWNEANESLQRFPPTLTTTIEKFNSIACKLQELKNEDKSVYEEIYHHLEAIDNLLSINSASTSNEVSSVTFLTKSQVPVVSLKRLKCDEKQEISISNKKLKL